MATDPGIVCGKPLIEAALQEGFCAQEIPVEFQGPRTILSVSENEFLVFQRSYTPDREVLRVFDSNGDGLPDEAEPIGASGGNHGMALRDGYLYLSDDSTVRRWKYEPGASYVTSSFSETVVKNINEDGTGGAPMGHKTRTLIFDDVGRLYVSVGSAGNVDHDSHRSRVRRLPVADDGVALPLDFQTSEVFADGLRNSVGLAFDRHGVLWGTENGADNLHRADLGGDVHNDNPAEELNRFPESSAGSHWGYPECWTEYDLPDSLGAGRGTQWAWPSFLEGGSITDERCRAERVPAELSMQAHSAPLGMTFYEHAENRPEGCHGGFPESMDGHAFVAFHGSWNRDVPTGYKVVRVPMTPDGRVNATEPVDLLWRKSSDSAKWSSGFRPADVDFDECGRLLVASDGTRGGRGSKVVRIAFGNESCCGVFSGGECSKVNSLFLGNLTLLLASYLFMS